MKRIAFVFALVLLAITLCGCSVATSPKVDDFEFQFRILSEDPEGSIALSIRNNNTLNLEEAFTALAGYTSKDWYVSANDAEDAWIYVSHYIDALHAEIDELYRLYREAY